MTLDEAKKDFITTWGKLSIEWGSNKTTGQVQGLLLVAMKPLSTNEIMEHLNISRGGVNMSLRSLVQLRLAKKVCKVGERMDFFIAEKDPYNMFKSVLEYRKRKELDPMLKVLSELKGLKPNCPESEELCNTVQNLYNFSQVANIALENLIHTDPRWLTTTFEKNK